MNSTKSVYALSLIMVGIGIAANAHSQSFLTNGLIAYYPLTSDGTDQSGQGLDLTLNNVLFSTVGSGKDIRPAASFDGESSYAIVNQTLITRQTNWTWSAWLYSPPETPYAYIYAEGNQPGPCFGIFLNYLPATLGISAWNAAFLPANWLPVEMPNVLTNGWNHLTFTVADAGVGTGTLNVYFNGVLTNSSLFQSAVPQDASPRIGIIGNGWGVGLGELTAPWKGSMSDLRFYNRALSSSEVAHLYAIESTPPPPSLALTIKLTLSQQNTNRDNGATTFAAAPEVFAYATADILRVLAFDEHQEGNWQSNIYSRINKRT